MDNDIVPALLESIEKEFDNRTFNSATLKNAIQSLQNKKATYRDVNDFAIEVGSILSDVFASNINADVLPDGKMYYNIADRILSSTLKKNHSLITGYSGDVQGLLNQAAGLNLKNQVPDLNQDRIDGLVNRLASEDSFDNVKWLLDDPIVNFSQSVVDDSIKKNADFHYKSGLRPTITRRVFGHACDWCQNLAGVYNYHEEPDDVYHRHERCRCIVEYDPGDGRRQNVWSKDWKDPHEQSDLKSRRAAGLNDLDKLNKDAQIAMNKTNMREQVGDENYRNFLEHLKTVDDPRIKEMFARMGDQLEFAKISPNIHPHAARNVIQLDPKSFTGEDYRRPFQTVYHEMGHAFDSLGMQKLKDKQLFPTGQTYKKKVLGKNIDIEVQASHASGLPEYSLNEAIKNDIWTAVNGDLPTFESLGKRPRKKAEKEAYDAESSRIFKEWQKNEKQFLEKYKGLAEKDLAAYGALSDMMESTGYFKGYPLGIGHGLNYWKTYGFSETEFFAHMTELVSNNESAKIMREIFPNSVKIWENIVDDILRKVR